jgi:hypothetical protein
MTKSQQIAALLLRPEGTTYSEVVAMTGWASVSIPRQAELNRLRLQTVERPGEPKRFFGYKPTIKIRERADTPPPSPPSLLPSDKIIPPKPKRSYRVWRVADVCAAANMEVVCGRGGRYLRCKQCALNYLIGDRDLVRVEIVEHVKHHAQTHVRQRERAERRNGS